MSVATKNPFAILNAEDDSRPSTPAVVAQKETSQPPTAPNRGAQKSRGGPASRGGKYYQRGGATKAAPRDVTQNQNGVEEPAQEGPRKFEGGGRGRGRGGRGDRGGDRGGGRGGRRQFDRHSQTGKTDSEKKIHQSWGGDDGNAELRTEEAANVDAAAEGVNNDWGENVTADWGAPTITDADVTAPVAEGEKNEGRPRKEKEPEEEDNTLTFDQYLAQKKDKESAVPKLENTRKANEGADNIWKDAVPLSKNEDEESYFIGKAKSTPKARSTKKDEKIYIEIDARFDRPDRGGRGRGRGDRGDRGRGGRGRGGRGGRQPITNTVVDVGDQNAFPSLA